MSVKDHISQLIATNIVPLNGTRYHLGMSEIGHPCERYLWFHFRHAQPDVFDTRTLLKFADGHRCEEAMAKLIGATDRQERAVLLGGWFSGSIDGKLGEAIWEHKASDKLDEFRRSKSLRTWNPRYYAQAVMYMHAFNAPSHVITVSNHGFTDWDCKETEPNEEYALELIEKARRVIFSDRPPAFEEIFECRWCSQSGVCCESVLPERNCRTCCQFSISSDSQWEYLNGTWLCEHHKKRFSMDQMKPCQHHQFNPFAVPGELQADGTYTLRNGDNYADNVL